MVYVVKLLLMWASVGLVGSKLSNCSKSHKSDAENVGIVFPCVRAFESESGSLRHQNG